MRRRMLRASRVILHLFSGPDVKTWKQLEDSKTVVICVDKVLNPKNGPSQRSAHAVFVEDRDLRGSSGNHWGSALQNSVCMQVCDDNGPKPVRSETEPYGLESLTSKQREWVEDDIALFFKMKLIYMVAEHNKPRWCDKVIFGLEQPQDPREYRSQQDVDKRQYMSVWRMESWRRFQNKYKLMLTSFEQGAFGHIKV